MLTPTGSSTLLAAVTLYGAAVALGYPELAVPAVAGGVALGIALITVTRRADLHLTMNVGPSMVSRGEQVTANVNVRNERGSRSPGFWLSLPHGEHNSQIVIRSLAKHQNLTIPLTLECDHRGVTDIGPLTIQQRDIFGLCRRSRVVVSAVTVCVLPVVHPIPLPSARLRQVDGAASAGNSGNGIAFHSLRGYVPGDDLRHVHWLKSAGTTGLLVRRHADAASASCIVLLDTCDGAYGSGPRSSELFETAVDLAASILVASARNGYRIRLHTTGGVSVIADQGRRDSAQRVLDALARVQPGGHSLRAAVNVVALGRDQASRQIGILTLITGPESEVPGTVLHSLRRRHRHVITIRLDQDAAAQLPRDNRAIPGIGAPVHAFRSATAAQAAAQWAATVAPGRSQAW